MIFEDRKSIAETKLDFEKLLYEKWFAWRPITITYTVNIPGLGQCKRWKRVWLEWIYRKRMIKDVGGVVPEYCTAWKYSLTGNGK